MLQIKIRKEDNKEVSEMPAGTSTLTLMPLACLTSSEHQSKGYELDPRSVRRLGFDTTLESRAYLVNVISNKGEVFSFIRVENIPPRIGGRDWIDISVHAVNWVNAFPCPYVADTVPE